MNSNRECCLCDARNPVVLVTLKMRGKTVHACGGCYRQITKKQADKQAVQPRKSA